MFSICVSCQNSSNFCPSQSDGRAVIFVFRSTPPPPQKKLEDVEYEVLFFTWAKLMWSNIVRLPFVFNVSYFRLWLLKTDRKQVLNVHKNLCFSAPGPKAQVLYGHHVLSVVRPFVVNFFYFQLLFGKCWTEFRPIKIDCALPLTCPWQNRVGR